ncbi:MAG: DegT/DnrJ/EryC1/StrS family aminotransferase [Anaerolineales bacterium]|nr:MAG: DegT/DnrJ/EryC1/StrS family aminotransferase [Anaerolineales bacterium]
MIPVFDLKDQYNTIKDEVNEAVARVLESGWFILGKEVEAFEEEFAAYCGLSHGIGVGSGTEALHLALLACGVGPGDEVITVPHTAVATVAAIELTGAQPVFVDIDPASYTIVPDQLESRITARTRAIVPVHLYGQAAALDPILEIAQRYGLTVVEDCAQAHGAKYRGRRVGSLGPVACFSFYPTKNLGAYGDGGMVVTDDGSLAQKVRLLRQYGWEKRYVSSLKGLNSRLDELQAAILRVKLKHLDEWNKARRTRARLYDELLAGSGVAIPTEMDYGRHVYHLYVVRCPHRAHRDELKSYLVEHGVGTAIHYPVPIHLQEAYRDLGYRQGDFPVTEACADEILSLPMYPELREDEVRETSELVKAYNSEQGEYNEQEN